MIPVELETKFLKVYLSFKKVDSVEANNNLNKLFKKEELSEFYKRYTKLDRYSKNKDI